MEGIINTKLLKNLILAAIDDKQAHMKVYVFLLIFNEYVGKVLKQALSYSQDGEVLSIVEVTRMV